MPDITKCEGTGCTLKHKCLRYTATPGLRQSYFLEVPHKDGECRFFWQTSFIVNNQNKE